MDLEHLRQRPTSEEINALPLVSYEGKVEMVRNLKQWRAAWKNLQSESVLGFDTETRPTFRKGKMNTPALIQIAGSTTVYILQLRWLPFGKHIADLLENSEIVKVGVGIAEDMKALGSVYPFQAQGLIDLGDMARENSFNSHGLRTLAASLFGWRISKGPQCSNWNVRELSPRQIAYAATDAWISRKIYLRLSELGRKE